MPGDKKKLHQGLVSEGLYTKSYEEFDAQFSTPEKVQKLYEGVNQKGLYTKSFDEFNNQFFSQPTTTTEQLDGNGFVRPSHEPMKPLPKMVDSDPYKTNLNSDETASGADAQTMTNEAEDYASNVESYNARQDEKQMQEFAKDFQEKMPDLQPPAPLPTNQAEYEQWQINQQLEGNEYVSKVKSNLEYIKNKPIEDWTPEDHMSEVSAKAWSAAQNGDMDFTHNAYLSSSPEDVQAATNEVVSGIYDEFFADRKWEKGVNKDKIREYLDSRMARKKFDDPLKQKYFENAVNEQVFGNGIDVTYDRVDDLVNDFREKDKNESIETILQEDYGDNWKALVKDFSMLKGQDSYYTEKDSPDDASKSMHNWYGQNNLNLSDDALRAVYESGQGMSTENKFVYGGTNKAEKGEATIRWYLNPTAWKYGINEGDKLSNSWSPESFEEFRDEYRKGNIAISNPFPDNQFSYYSDKNKDKFLAEDGLDKKNQAIYAANYSLTGHEGPIDEMPEEKIQEAYKKVSKDIDNDLLENEYFFDKETKVLVEKYKESEVFAKKLDEINKQIENLGEVADMKDPMARKRMSALIYRKESIESSLNAANGALKDTQKLILGAESQMFDPVTGDRVGADAKLPSKAINWNKSIEQKQKKYASGYKGSLDEAKTDLYFEWKALQDYITKQPRLAKYRDVVQQGGVPYEFFDSEDALLNKYQDLSAELKAVSNVLATNFDPADLPRPSFVTSIGKGLATSLGGERAMTTTTDEVRSYVSAARSKGVEITQEQEDRIISSLSEKTGEGLGSTLKAMGEIALASTVGSKVGVFEAIGGGFNVIRNIAAVKDKAWMLNSLNFMEKSLVSGLTFEYGGQDFTTGVGEATGGQFASMLGGKLPVGMMAKSPMGMLFSKLLLTTTKKVGGATGQTLEEYTGEFFNELSKNDLTKAWATTVGDSPWEKLFTMYVISGTLGVGTLGSDYKSAVNDIESKILDYDGNDLSYLPVVNEVRAKHGMPELKSFEEEAPKEKEEVKTPEETTTEATTEEAAPFDFKEVKGVVKPEEAAPTKETTVTEEKAPVEEVPAVEEAPAMDFQKAKEIVKPEEAALKQEAEIKTEENVPEQKVEEEMQGEVESVQEPEQPVTKEAEQEVLEKTTPDDTKDETRVPSEEQITEEPIETKPDEKAGGQETEAGGMVQETQEEVKTTGRANLEKALDPEQKTPARETIRKALSYEFGEVEREIVKSAAKKLGIKGRSAMEGVFNKHVENGGDIESFYNAIDESSKEFVAKKKAEEKVVKQEMQVEQKKHSAKIEAARTTAPNLAKEIDALISEGKSDKAAAKMKELEDLPMYGNEFVYKGEEVSRQKFIDQARKKTYKAGKEIFKTEKFTDAQKKSNEKLKDNFSELNNAIDKGDVKESKKILNRIKNAQGKEVAGRNGYATAATQYVTEDGTVLTPEQAYKKAASRVAEISAKSKDGSSTGIKNKPVKVEKEAKATTTKKAPGTIKEQLSKIPEDPTKLDLNKLKVGDEHLAVYINRAASEGSISPSQKKEYLKTIAEAVKKRNEAQAALKQEEQRKLLDEAHSAIAQENRVNKNRMDKFGDKLFPILQKAFPGANVVTNREGIAERALEIGLDPDVIAFYDPNTNTVYLDLENASSDAIMEEYSHLWLDFLRNKHPDIYQKGVDLIKETEYHSEAKKNYPETASKKDGSSDLIENEALVQAIIDGGQAFLDTKISDVFRTGDSIVKRFKTFRTWLKNFWARTNKLLGVSPTVNLSKLTLDQFTRYAAADLLSGKQLTNEPTPLTAKISGSILADRGTFQRSKDWFNTRLKSAKGMDAQTTREIRRALGRITGRNKQVEFIAEGFRRNMLNHAVDKGIITKSQKDFFNKKLSSEGFPPEFAKMMQQIQTALTTESGVNTLEGLGFSEEVIESVTKMRETIDEMSNDIRLIKKAFGELSPELEASIDGNMNVYIHRSYAMHDDPKYYKNIEKYVGTEELNKIKRRVFDDMSNNKIKSVEITSREDGGYTISYTNKKGFISKPYELGENENITQALADVVGDDQAVAIYEAFKLSDNPEFTHGLEKSVEAQGMPFDVKSHNVEEFIEALTNVSYKGSMEGGISLRAKKSAESITKKRGEIDEDMRKLMGEYTNPYVNFMKTGVKQASLIEMMKLDDALMAEHGGTLITQNKTARNTKKISIKGKEMWTTPQMYDLYYEPSREFIGNLTSFFKPDDEAGISQNAAMDFVRALAANVKGNLTIYSPGSQARNFVGAILSSLNTGPTVFMRPRYASKAIKVITSDFSTSEKVGLTMSSYMQGLNIVSSAFAKYDKAKLEAELTELAKYGLNDQSLAAGIVTDLVEHMNTGNAKGVRSWMKKASKKYTGFFSKPYQVTDLLAKKILFDYEVEQMNDIYSKEVSQEMEDKVFDDRVFMERMKEIDGSKRDAAIRKEIEARTEERIKEMAAEKVREEQPTYSDAPELFKSASRSLFGPSFILFTTEQFRNRKNAIVNVAKDLAVNAPRLAEKGMEAEANKLRWKATKQLGSMALSYSATTALSWMFMDMFGWSDDEDEAFKDLQPEYMKNSIILYMGGDKLNPTFMDLSYVDPFSYYAKIISAYSKGDTFSESVSNAFKESTDSFFTTEIFTKRMWQVLNNEDEYGKKFAEDYEGSTLEKFRLQITRGFLYDNRSGKDKLGLMVPGFAKSAYDIYKGWEGYESASGRKYSFGNELSNVLFGVKQREIDVITMAGYANYSQSKSVIEAISGHNRGIIDGERVQEVADEAFDRQREIYEDMKALGASEADMMKVFVMTPKKNSEGKTVGYKIDKNNKMRYLTNIRINRRYKYVPALKKIL